jgi:MYXO-CTERM domain-containing protein
LSEPIAPQAGTFKARWEVTPLAADTDGLTGLSQGSAGGWSAVAAIVRFAATGQVDARNGSEYQAVSAASWNAQQTYEVRVQVDLAAHSWSAWIAPKGGTEVQLANGFAFRSEQAEVASLDHFVVGAETGSLQACSFLLGDKPAGDAGAPEGQGGAAGNPGAGGASGTAGAAGSSAAGAPGAAGTSSSNGVSDPSDAGDGGSCTVASRPASPAPSWFAFALLALVGAAAARRSRAGQWRAA